MDLDALVRIQREAFGGTLEEGQFYRELTGDENQRTVEVGGETAGGLSLIPMGQYFGGRSVSMTGIGGVAIAPEFRGKGLAGRLMTDAVKDLHERGVALSTLSPATEPLYRRAGYEQAGSQLGLRLALFSIDARERELPCKRVGDGDMEAVQAIHSRFAARNPGNLDRTIFRWSVIRKKTEGFLFGDEAYLFYRTVKLSGETRRIVLVVDHAAVTPRGVRRILAFLAEHASLYREALLMVGPGDPFLATVNEQRYTPHFLNHWMLRVTHLESAIAQRGYHPGRSAELHLRLSDDVIEAHEGNWTVRIEEGVGQAEPGGRGEIALDIRALASLYSGHLSVDTLQTTGWIEGPDTALATAQSVFSGPAPWMSDSF